MVTLEIFSKFDLLKITPKEDLQNLPDHEGTRPDPDDLEKISPKIPGEPVSNRGNSSPSRLGEKIDKALGVLIAAVESFLCHTHTRARARIPDPKPAFW